MRSLNRFFIGLIALVVIMVLVGRIEQLPGATAVLCIGMAWGVLTAATSMNVTHDLVSNVGFGVSFYPQSVTADAAKSVGIDVRGYESVAFLQVAGAIAGAGLVKLVPQECDTLGGTYTDVAAADLDGAFVDAVANTTQKVGYKGNKDFVALRADYTSGTSVIIGGVVVLSDARIREVA